MTKILMTSVRDDEQTAINEYAKEHNIEIITTPKLIDDAVELTADVDGLVIQQRSKVPADIYEKLHTNGLKQIATRTAGFDMVDIKKANENDLVVTNVPAYSPRSVAEFALMQIFRLLRKTYRFDSPKMTSAGLVMNNQRKFILPRLELLVLDALAEPWQSFFMH
ncbi:D-lactate dehydrogenase [Limosilactobacillus reuteri]|uniref:D-lactate dehydrogenase n=1 Tax=Limosilactobacillus reuteri TaxID=1598 RepID=A0A0U5K0I1_LIMRT|nr:D-lactate dehydrogenase [Limosilactobacillus reuteri]